MRKIAILVACVVLLLAGLSAGQSVENTVQATVNINPNIGVEPLNLTGFVPPVANLTKTITVTNNAAGNTQVLVTAGGEIASWMHFSIDNFTLGPSEQSDVLVTFVIPDVEPRTYFGTITINGQEIPVELTVTKRYKLSLDIHVTESVIPPGGTVFILTDISMTKQRRRDPALEGEIAVDVAYDILKGKTIVASTTTTILVNGFPTTTAVIPLPVDAATGRYKVEATATHRDKTTTDRDAFRVSENTGLSLFWEIVTAIGL